MVRIFVVTTRGLEALSASELGEVPGVQVQQIAYRRITAVCRDLSPLLRLHTVDDVFLDVATWSGLARQRDALSRLRSQAERLDLRPALAYCAAVRSVPPSPAFSLTVNFVGKRNYTTDEIRQICATAISARHGWRYTPDDEAADLNVRIFIEHEAAWVGVRLGDRPLHRRAYKRDHVLGSLKPPVAAAMLRLAGVRPGERVLDPCCGAGTLLIEAAISGAQAWGGDCSGEALSAARSNAVAAGAPLPLHRWDALRLPLRGAVADCVLSNPPWGRAVTVGVNLPAFYEALGDEVRRVLAPGGRIVLLTNIPDVRIPDLRLDTALEISLFGQTPSILVFLL